MEWTNYVNDTTAAGVRPEQQRVGSIDPRLDEVISQTQFENEIPLLHSAVRSELRHWRLRLPIRLGPGIPALAAVRGQSRPDDGRGRGRAFCHIRRLQEPRSGLHTRGAQ